MRLSAFFLLLTAAVAADSTDPRLKGLPAELKSQALKLLNGTSEEGRAKIAGDLARRHGSVCAEFLLSVLEKDSSRQVRLAIVDRLGRTDVPGIQPALERHAASDPDAEVSALALETLHQRQTRKLLRLAERRLQMARDSGSREDRRLLAVEQERWITLERNGALPGFMRTPPPVFSVKPANQPIRVLAFGDYGQGTELQKKTAGAMLAYHRRHPFDFAITLGDNFYSKGMESPSDPRWKTWWDDLYDPLGIRFFASLGNHDWGLPDSPAAEVVYSAKSPSWRMPATRYTFTAGPAQFFAIDSQVFSEAQALWLEEELEKSTAKWKIVYGHHPIYSHGAHGDTKALIAQLLPVLKGRADAYYAGHEHDLQHLKPEGNVHLFISGGGGARPRPLEMGPRSLFAAATNGFAILEVSEGELKTSFVDFDLKPLYEHTIRK